MKLKMYYFKKTDSLFAYSIYKDLRQEFEDTFNMDLFYIKTLDLNDEDNSKFYKNKLRDKSSYALWRFTMTSSDGDIVISMPEWCKNIVFKAYNHFQYNIKSAVILTKKFNVLSEYHVKQKYQDAIYDLQDYDIDMYKLWFDIFKPLLKNVSIKEDSDVVHILLGCDTIYELIHDKSKVSI